MLVGTVLGRCLEWEKHGSREGFGQQGVSDLKKIVVYSYDVQFSLFDVYAMSEPICKAYHAIHVTTYPNGLKNKLNQPKGQFKHPLP